MAENLKEVRTRIKSVKSTQQITKAMKMVAAAKLRRAQQSIIQMRPYANKLNTMLTNIVSNLEGDMDISYGKERTVGKALVVVVTSNRGLCGAFNTNVIKAAVAVIDKKFSEVRKKGQLSILCIGKKGNDFFSKHYTDCNIINNYVEVLDKIDFNRAANVANLIMEGFDTERYDAVEVAYGRFRNPVVQYCVTETYLPVAKIEKEESDGDKFSADFIFEPNKNSLLNSLVPSILQTKFYRYLLDTSASEHGARMTAMDAATENAEELLKTLKLSYNKARQAAITKEILEIVSGAAALEG